MSGNLGNRSTRATDSEPAVCRDFLRNVCKRGRRCKFFHPTQDECDKIRRSERIFCHDFQNSICRRIGCKFLHYSREDEEFFRLFGYLPDESDKTKMRSSSTSVDEQPPVCKDYLNGTCCRGSGCKYRHVSNCFEKDAHLRASMENLMSMHPDHLNREPTVPEYGALICSSSQASVISSSETKFNCPISLAHSGALTLPVSSSNADRLCFQQPSVVTTNPVAPPDSVLTPVKDVYLSSATVPTPVVGVIDHAALPASNIRHAVYAHPSSLGTFTPLMSVSNAAQHVPCSSVLAVVAEPSQHPAVIQHPSTSQTTYHLLPGNAPGIQQHLLSAASSASSGAALLTIPVPQYPCSTGPMIGTHVSVTCSAPQHPAMLTTVLSTNRTLTANPTSGYSSYNLLQITPSSTVEPLPVFSSQQTVPEVKTSAASTTAVLAAAAAAGYFAQHLPVMTGGSVACPGTSCLTSDTQSTVDSCESTVLNTNIPAVSVAAAAVVAAAKAFANRAKSETCETNSSSLGSLQCRKINGACASHQSSSTVAGSDVGENSCPCSTFEPSETNNCIGSSTVSPIGNPSRRPGSATHFVHRAQQDEEHAKAAAAVAAAACIGAMFSQPLSDGCHRSSSVAAMLDNLIHNRQPVSQASCGSEYQESRRSTQHLPDETSCSLVADKCSVSRTESAGASQLNLSDRGLDSTGPAEFPDTLNAELGCLLNKGRSSRRVDEQSPTLSSFHEHSAIDFSKSPSWSSVATTVASAAQAAAAAAVAATAAVTRSAKFFQINRKRKSSHSVERNLDSVGKLTVPSGSETVKHFDNDRSHASEVDRTTLSPNTAATMTSAAAAAAMAAAAASAAAKQRILSEAKKSSHASHADCVYSGPSRLDVSPKMFYNTQQAERSGPFEQDGYTPVKRRNNIRGSLHRRYYHSRFRRKPVLPRSALEADDEHGLSDDDIDETISASPSPDVSPQYNPPIDRSVSFGDTFNASISELCTNSSWDPCKSRNSKFRYLTSGKCEMREVDATMSADSTVRDCSALHRGMAFSTNSSVPNNCANSEGICRLLLTRSNVIPASNCLMRRSHSTSSLHLLHFTVNRTLFRSNSFPTLPRQQFHQPASSCFHSSVETAAADSSSATYSGLNVRTKSRNFHDFHKDASYSLLSRKLNRIHPTLSLHSRGLNSSGKMRLIKSALLSTHSDVSHNNSNGRMKENASPESVLTEDFSGQDDVDDLDYLDTEDCDDDDTYELRHSKFLFRRKPSDGRPPKLRKLSVRDRLPSATLSALAYTSVTMRQQQALKAENARLRRKLSDLMRQRGDLRAANEILLEQNARLRHSGKLATAAMRMSKRVRNIEVHQPQYMQSGSRTVGASLSDNQELHCPHSGSLFSFTNAHGTFFSSSPDCNVTAARGVYVSSPTAPNTQQTLQAVATHTIFPSAVVASAVPGTITLSSHPSLAAVQIQTPTESLASTTVSTHPTLVTENQAREHPSIGIPGYYQHQLQHPLGSLPVSISSVPTHPNLAAVSSTLQVCHYPVHSATCAPYPSHQPTVVTPSVMPVGAPSAVTLLVGQPAYTAIQSHLSPSIHIQSGVKADPSPVNLTPLSPVPYIYQSSPTGSIIAQSVPCSPLSKSEPQIPSSIGSMTSDRLIFRDSRFKIS